MIQHFIHHPALPYIIQRSSQACSLIPITYCTHLPTHLPCGNQQFVFFCFFYFFFFNILLSSFIEVNKSNHSPSQILLHFNADVLQVLASKMLAEVSGEAFWECFIFEKGSAGISVGSFALLPAQDVQTMPGGERIIL